MILRRFSDAIRKQDWFTVVIEFVIVVTGIFVALQADNWNEARLERVQERSSLERLLKEAENSVAYVEREIDAALARINAQRQLLAFLSSDRLLPEDTEVATFGFVSLNFFPAMAPARTAYDELSATGGLQLIRSADVRDALSRYYAELDFHLAQLSYFRDFSISSGNDPFIAARDFVRAEYDPDSRIARRQVIDWAGLRSDHHLTTMFVGKLRNQIVMNENRVDLLNRAQTMCEVIAKAIDSKCEPARNSASE